MNKAREKFTGIVLSSLKEETIPWRKNWSTTDLFTNINAITKAPYNGVNAIILSCAKAKMNYKDPRWMTFNKIKEMKYHLVKESKGVAIEYWYFYNSKAKKSLSIPEYNKLLLDSPEKAKGYAITSKMYYVFNGDCIEGLPKLDINKEKLNIVQQVSAIESISKNMHLPVLYGGKDAYYSPAMDSLHLPTPQSFNSLYDYVSVAMHEMSHATGHKERLNRNLGGRFGHQDYAIEELVAEISSLFTSSYFENPTPVNVDNHKAYIQNWALVIENNPNVLFECIKQAEASADYLIQHGEFEKIIEQYKISHEKDIIEELERECENGFN